MAWMSREERREVHRGSDAAAALAAELVAGVLAYGAIGWVLDRYVFHTAPWLMAAGFILGFALGMYVLYGRMMEEGRVEDARRAELRRRGAVAPRRPVAPPVAETVIPPVLPDDNPLQTRPDAGPPL